MGAELSILLGGQTEHRPKEEKQQKQKRKFKKDGVGVGRGHVVAKEVKAKEEEEGRQGGDRAKGAGGARDGRNRRANIMHHSPFRGLRRAASSSASSINCCSSVPCATSTTGHTYPYPRTHSTLMVIPSAVRPPIVSTGAGTIGSRNWASSVNTSGTTRPQSLLDSMDEQNNNNEQLLLHFPYHPNGGQPLLSNNNNNNNNEGEPWPTDGGVHVQQQQQQRQSLVSQYGFQTHRPRPPLNRAIPPIPESRSNESIQSGLVARQQSVGSVAVIHQQIAQIIDENNPIDAEMTPADGEKVPEHLAAAERSGVESAQKREAAKKAANASRLPKLMRRKTKEQREAPSKTAAENCKATPKSPLMSVAHSVKTRLTRLTALKQAKDALPMSRSLEIGRQQSRIPTVCGDPMTKSWSLETTTPNMNSSEMPRRGPMTTLLPSPRGVPRRLPPGEETDDHSTGKQVQFAPLPVLSSTTELRRVPEMEFTELTFEEREKERPRGNRTKMTVIEAEATLSTVPPPLPKSSPPQLWPSLSTPKTLRKSPQSFPPMGAHSAPISFADDVPPVRVRAAKSALSVSFGAVEGGGPIRDRKAQHGAPEARGGKRRVFCSRSLRLVATRVCEASPLLVRRRRGRSAGRDGTGDRETAKTTRTTDQQKEASSSSSYTGLFRKRHSVPAEQKAKSKSFSESASITSAGAATTGVRLRSVRSVTDSRAQKVNAAGVPQHRRVAPLAESESSRVADENSPAVEQCGAVPWKMGIKMTERRGFFGGKIKNGRANVGSATNTTAPKEGQKSKSFAAALYPPPPTFRPTLAQLLASPQPRKKSPGDNTGPKARSGLIDDEIGDQPMLISASPPAVLSTDFRLIDELSSGPSPAVTQTQSNNANKMSPSSPADSSDAPSSVVLVAEQWAGGGDPRGEILLVQSRLESALKIGGRKRNARSRSDPKGAKVNGNAAGAAAAPCHASTSEVTAKRPPPPAHPTELPKDVKSEDGAAVFFPVLLSDFRSDLHQLQDSLRRDLEELETLRLQNAVLRQQLAERDRIIASLQQQLRGQNG